MKYMLLIYVDPEKGPAEGTRGGARELASAGPTTPQTLAEAGVLREGAALQAPTTATTVSQPNGQRVVTDGPFAETKEWLGGYYVVDVRRSRRRARARRAHAQHGRGTAPRCARRPRDVSDEASSASSAQESGRVLATLIRHLGGDFELAEDALQDAFAVALATWPRDGVAGQPRRLDHDDRPAQGDRPPAPRARAARPPAGPAQAHGARTRRRRRGAEPTTSALADDRLRLVFTCCHPALAMDARVALTLRTLGGLTTRRDRARVPRPRADDGPAPRARQAQDRRRRASPTAFPATPSCPTGSPACSPSSTSSSTRATRPPPASALVREELCAEAIRLGAAARRAHARRRRDARACSRSCCCTTRAAPRARDARRRLRRAARPGPRALGPRDGSTRACATLDRALRLRRPGPYQLQAAIAALHAGPSPVGLAADRRALRRARRASRRRRSSRSTARSRSAMADGRARRGPRPLLDATSGSTTTSRCTPRAPSCCAAPATTTAPARPTSARSSSARTRSSERSCSGGEDRCARAIHPAEGRRPVRGPRAVRG